jgi:AcrR family transcriptional regulator
MATTDASVTDVGGRRALIDATVAAIEEDGLAGVSLRSITRRANVSHAAPAHHFGDKAGLFTAVALEGFAMLEAAMTEARDKAQRSGPAKRLQALAIAYVTFATEHRAHFEVMFRPELLRRSDADLQRAGMATFAVLRESVRSAHDEGFGRGVDVDELTLASWALTHGIVALTTQGVLGPVGFPGSPVDLAATLTGLMGAAITVADDQAG